MQYRTTLADYQGSGYDLGHQAPAADMRSTATTMKQSFLPTFFTELPDEQEEAMESRLMAMWGN